MFYARWRRSDMVWARQSARSNDVLCVWRWRSDNGVWFACRAENMKEKKKVCLVCENQDHSFSIINIFYFYWQIIKNRWSVCVWMVGRTQLHVSDNPIVSDELRHTQHTSRRTWVVSKSVFGTILTRDTPYVAAFVLLRIYISKKILLFSLYQLTSLLPFSLI